MNDVSLLEMLNARELRCQLQQNYLQEYKRPLICLTLNIPGPVKVLPGVPDAYDTGRRRIEESLKENRMPIVHLEMIKEKTGYEAFYSVDAPPELIKEHMITLEDQDELGRLFDIDVLRPDGTKVSREELGLDARRCLLCNHPAHACSRSRTHSVKELVARITDILTPEKGLT